MSSRVVLIGKPGCHLCDVAREVLDIVCADADLDFTELSIYDDPRLADRYHDRIPVVLVDGQVVAQFRVDAAALRTVLGVG